MLLCMTVRLTAQLTAEMSAPMGSELSSVPLDEEWSDGWMLFT